MKQGKKNQETRGKRKSPIILDAFKFVHSVNRCLWLRNEERLSTRRIQRFISDIREVQRAQAGAVDEKRSRRQVLQQLGYRSVVSTHERDAFAECLLLEPGRGLAGQVIVRVRHG